MFGINLYRVVDTLSIKGEERLKEIYSHGIPKDISARYCCEDTLGWRSEDLCDRFMNWFIYYLIEDEAYKLNMPLFKRGCANNSIIAFKYGRSIINPMKSHYYCSKCGHLEYITNCYFAIDADDKKCPNCNANMDKMGFSLDERFAFGTKNDPKKYYVVYTVVDDFIPFAIKRIKDSFEAVKFDIGDVVKAAYDMEGEGYDFVVGLVILSPGKCLDDYPDRIVKLKSGELAYNALYLNKSDKPKPSQRQELKPVMLFPSSINNNIYKWQNKTGICHLQVINDALESFDWNKMIESSLPDIYDDEDDLNDIRERVEKILRAFKPSSYYEMVEAISASHNTWKDYNNLSYPDGISESPFYSRDALMHILVECGNDEENAYRIAEFVRRGGVDSRPDEWYELVASNNMTKDICDACEEYKYLWPQSHSLDLLIALALDQYYRKLVK